MIGGIAPATREVLQRVAVVGSSFDTDEFVALSGLPEDEAFDHLDAALAALIVEPASAGYRFRHGLVRDALLDDLPPHRRRRIHRDAAEPPDRAAARRRHASVTISSSRVPPPTPCPTCCAPPRREAAVGAYRDALALVDARPAARHRSPPRRRRCRCAATCSTRSATRWQLGLPGGTRRGRTRRGSRAPRSARSQRGDVGRPRDRRGRTRRPRHRRGSRRRRHPACARGKYAFFTSDFDVGTSGGRRSTGTGPRGRARLEGARSRLAAGLARASLRQLVRSDCASSCAEPVRTRRSPTPSSTAISAPSNTCCTARCRTPRSSPSPATCRRRPDAAARCGPPPSPRR